MSPSDKNQKKYDDHDSSKKNVQDKNTHGKHPKTISAWQDLISQRIEDAAKQGAFEDLRGKGKPLDLRKNPFAPEGKELAFDLLDNNDLAPAWISQRKEIQAAIAKLRTRIQQDITYYRESNLEKMDAPDADSLTPSEILPQARLDKWRAEIAEINKQIDTLNLSQPIAHLEVLKLRLDDELNI